MEGISFIVDPENTVVAIHNKTNKKVDAFTRNTYPHNEYWNKLIEYLRTIGFEVDNDKSVSKLIRDDYIKGKKGGLEFKGHIYPAGLCIDFYQNIVYENRNGGEYDFNKYQKMPHLIRLQLIKTCNQISIYLKSLGLIQEVVYRPKTAIDKIKWNYVKSWHHPQNDMNFNLEDIDGTTVTESYNNNDRDKNIIHNGEVKYFRDFNGFLSRGKVYHNINNMWWVITDKYTTHNVASFELFNPNESDFKQRRIKHGYAPIEFVNKHIGAERKYIAVSIKRSIADKETKKLILWGTNRSLDDKPRCFTGYTQDINRCELYKLEDFQNTYGDSYIKCDEPVKITLNLFKKYKAYDTVLVDFEEYKRYLEFCD